MNDPRTTPVPPGSHDPGPNDTQGVTPVQAAEVPDKTNNEPEAGPERLEDVLPEIQGVAQKVGGMKNLKEIAETLDQAGE
jgi:hypothetical protein